MGIAFLFSFAFPSLLFTAICKRKDGAKAKTIHSCVVTGDRSKVQCYKEQYCIGTWNIRSMNQGKLEVIKKEMTRVNIDILEISELRWTGIGEFNSDDLYICSLGKNPLEEMK